VLLLGVAAQKKGELVSDCNVELAKEEDVAAMLALSNGAALNSVANFATEPESMDEWLGRWRAGALAFPWLVARRDRRVVGFAKASPHRTRGAYAWSAEVSLYVDPAQHRRGVGRKLYSALISTMRAQGYVTLLAGITKPNPASEGLHASFGFVPCGAYHHVGFKFGAGHDVGHWELHLVPANVAPKPIRPVDEAWTVVHALRADAASILIERTDLLAPAAVALVAELDAELSATYPETGATHVRHVGPCVPR
jgi:phosphinothricin acetyltransferase